MKNYEGLTDTSIPASEKAARKEEALLEKSLTAENIASSPRHAFLVDLLGIVDLSKKTIRYNDLTEMSPDEIFDLLSVVNEELGTSISDLKEILSRSRQKVKNIILQKVLGLEIPEEK